METYTLAACRLADLPALTLARADAPPEAPPAIVLHGLGGSKEWTLPTLYAFARRGLRAVAPDVRLHGERPGAAGRDARLQADYLAVMAEMIEGTASDVSRLLDALGAARAAVHGISLGGYVAFAALAADPRLAVGTVAMGSPDWLEAPRALGLGPGHPFYDAVAARSPLERGPEVYPPRPLLMLHGDADETVSPAGSRALHERLRPHYAAAPERLALVLYPGLGHHYTEDMMQRAADWTARFLPAGG